MNKKLYFLSLLVSLLITGSALAKTEGTYIGVDALYSQGKFYEKYKNAGDTTTNVDPTNFRGKKFSFGANIKHAFNFNGFYLSSGLFIERNNLRMTNCLSKEII